MSHDWLHEMTKACFMNKDLYERHRSAQQNKIQKEYEIQLYKERILQLTRSLLDKEPTTDKVWQDVMDSLEDYAKSCIQYFKRRDAYLEDERAVDAAAATTTTEALDPPLDASQSPPEPEPERREIIGEKKNKKDIYEKESTDKDPPKIISDESFENHEEIELQSQSKKTESSEFIHVL